MRLIRMIDRSFLEANPWLILLMSNRKHPDWKHHKLAESRTGRLYRRVIRTEQNITGSHLQNISDISYRAASVLRLLILHSPLYKTDFVLL